MEPAVELPPRLGAKPLKEVLVPLRYYRLKARMTAFDLAVESGVGFPYIYAVEGGNLKRPNPERAARLARVLSERLGLPYERLYEEILANEPMRVKGGEEGSS